MDFYGDLFQKVGNLIVNGVPLIKYLLLRQHSRLKDLYILFHLRNDPFAILSCLQNARPVAKTF
jgi:hypothetical protein